MSFLKKLFGGGAAAPKDEAKPEVYKDFKITADPIKDGSVYRIAAMIEKEVGGELKSHHLIRADTVGTHDVAVEASIAKAKLMIDQLGDRLFQRRV